jgi:hypothetical protein
VAGGGAPGGWLAHHTVCGSAPLYEPSQLRTSSRAGSVLRGGSDTTRGAAPPGGEA